MYCKNNFKRTTFSKRQVPSFLQVLFGVKQLSEFADSLILHSAHRVKYLLSLYTSIRYLCQTCRVATFTEDHAEVTRSGFRSRWIQNRKLERVTYTNTQLMENNHVRLICS